MHSQVVSRGGFHVGNGINWKGQIFAKMRNHTSVNKMPVSICGLPRAKVNINLIICPLADIRKSTANCANYSHFTSMQGVGIIPKKNHEVYLLEYELAHDDVDGECCRLCHR